MMPLYSASPLIRVLLVLCLVGERAFAERVNMFAAVPGSDTSENFVVDTRFSRYVGGSESRAFSIDTRYSGLRGDGDSELFSVDTRVLGGSLFGRGSIRGIITGAGMPLAGARVALERFGREVTHVATGPDGSFLFADEPPSLYSVAAKAAGYNSTWVTVAVTGPGSVDASLSLDPSHLPVIGDSARPVGNEAAALACFKEPSMAELASHLYLWAPSATGFLPGSPNPSKPSVVITHGWKSSAHESWVADLARAIDKATGYGKWNVMAWDWSDCANITPPPADRAKQQGYFLGKYLDSVLPAYNHAIHFIGHSLGSIVQRHAVDYLAPGGAGANMAHAPKPWFDASFHLTLCDEAEIAFLLMPIFGEKPLGRDVIAKFIANSRTLRSVLVWAGDAYSDWMSPIPIASVTYIDNYHSLIGVPSSKAVNVFLRPGAFVKLADYGDTSKLFTPFVAFHGYSYTWYTKSVQQPDGLLAGFGFSAEAGGLEYFRRTPSNGTLYLQPFDSSSEMALKLPSEADVEDELREVLSFANQMGNQVTLSVIQHFDANGNVDVVLDEENSTPQFGADSAPLNVQQKAIGTHRFTLPSALPFPSSGAMHALADQAASPRAVWLKLDVPADAVGVSFAFTFSGDFDEDYLAVAVGGTNVLDLDPRLFERDVTHSSGVIDVSGWAGKQMELFFGLVGGTGANGSASISRVSFYSALKPVLVVSRQDSEHVRLSWTIASGGGQVERTKSLSNSAWEALAGVIQTNLSYQLDVPVASATNGFFRVVK